MYSFAFTLYLLFTISWFTHLTARIPALGAIRFDLILVAILTFFAVQMPSNIKQNKDILKIHYALLILIAYMFISIPFVEWPGSVFNRGIPNFIKAVVFYFFTVKFVNNKKRLKIFMSVFISCQLFRILEPLYLHITTGYWGDDTFMLNHKFMNRLSGAPSDIVNPNGLAFIILLVFPFLYYFFSYNFFTKITFPIFMGLSIYALILTGSRSGFVGMLFIWVLFFVRSKRKFLILILFVVVASISVMNMSDDFKDRYLSLIDKNTNNYGTAHGRIEGVKKDFKVAMRRPIFGHGLGTSAEANYHFKGCAQPSHNLWTEILQEIGIVGLILFLRYVILTFNVIKKMFLRKYENIISDIFLLNLRNYLFIVFGINFLFSLASYGLSGYEWYLFPGIAMSVVRLISIRG